MNKLPLGKRVQILALLAEGNSLRSTSRLSGCSINTVTTLLVNAGKAAAKYQDAHLRNLSCQRIQVDEIWSFCYAKQKNLNRLKAPVKGAGNVWAWIAICETTKLVPCWLVGDRDIWTARAFIRDLASRIKNRIQLTSDALKSYALVVEGTFAQSIDYAMLKKNYDEKGKYTGSEKRVIIGFPNPARISTSYIERQNLTMRMGMRRYTRKTNGYSKKLENHVHAVALHFFCYNFIKVHMTLRTTPAMAAGVTDKLWEYEDLVGLIDEQGKILKAA